mgnify:FL=1
MARGGGTGSRTKQKKKSETTTTQNGAADTELKQNKTTKHRKQKVTFSWVFLVGSGILVIMLGNNYRGGKKTDVSSGFSVFFLSNKSPPN